MAAPQDSLLQRLFAHRRMEVIFDIGACSGADGVRYAQMFPGSRLYTFEPVPANYALVLQTQARHPDVRMEPFQLALSDTEGTAVLHLSSASGDMEQHGNKSSSLLPPGRTVEVFPWLEFKEKLEVRTRRLDAFCTEQGIPDIDLVHMDVQGAELSVLRGAGSMIQHIRAVWLEVERTPLYQGQPVKADIENFMRSNGFVLALSTVGSVAGDQLWVCGRLMAEQPASVRMLVWKHRQAWAWRSRVDRAKSFLRPWLRGKDRK